MAGRPKIVLEQGVKIKVVGGGRHGKGSICQPVGPDDTSISYRCNYNKGEHVVKKELVKPDRTPYIGKGTTSG